MTSTIGVDVSSMAGRRTGIGRATGLLVERMVQAAPDLRFVGIFRKMLGSRPVASGRRMRTVRLRLPRVAEPAIRALHLVERFVSADLYHATDFYLPISRRSRSICTVHDVLFLSDPEPAMPDHRRLRRWAPEFIRRSELVIVPSNYSRGEAVKWTGVDPSRVAVTPWGCSPEWRPSMDPERTRREVQSRLGVRGPYFLTASCSVGRKNTVAVLAAFSAASSRGCSAELVVVWSPPDDVRSKFRSDRIHVIPWQSDAELLQLYQGAICFLWGTRAEGFGFPVLEAMACGVPVICSGRTSLPEVGGDAPVYVDPDDVDGISDAILRLADASELRRRMAVMGVERVKAFSWDSCARATVDAYRRCL